LSELFGHLFNFETESGILVGDVSNKADSIVLEDSFFLEFVPFLLESVHGFFHLESLQEVADEIINDDITLKDLRGSGRHNLVIIATSALLFLLTLSNLRVGLSF